MWNNVLRQWQSQVPVWLEPKWQEGLSIFHVQWVEHKELTGPAIADTMRLIEDTLKSKWKHCPWEKRQWTELFVTPYVEDSLYSSAVCAKRSMDLHFYSASLQPFTLCESPLNCKPLRSLNLLVYNLHVKQSTPDALSHWDGFTSYKLVFDSPCCLTSAVGHDVPLKTGPFL